MSLFDLSGEMTDGTFINSNFWNDIFCIHLKIRLKGSNKFVNAYKTDF